MSKTAKQEVKWEAGNGSAVIVTVIATAGFESIEKVINADGHNINTSSKTIIEELSITATVDGVKIDGEYSKANHPVAVAKIGGLGILASNKSLIDAAIDATKSESRTDADYMVEMARQLDVANLNNNDVYKAMGA